MVGLTLGLFKSDASVQIREVLSYSGIYMPRINWPGRSLVLKLTKVGTHDLDGRFGFWLVSDGEQ